MLHIVVCVKAVPDPQKACAVKIDPATRTLTRCDAPMVMNFLDKNAMEAALALRRKHGGKITALSMGPPDAARIVTESIALGADEGILLTDPAFAGADAYATALTLAKAIEKLDPVDLVLCGMASSDGGTEWVGPEIAVFLNWPVVTLVNAIIDDSDRRWRVRAALSNGYRLMEVHLPAVFTVTRDLNKPSALSFSGIVKARRKPVTRWAMAELGIQAHQAGLKGSPTIVSRLEPVENKRKVEMLAGTMEEKAGMLIDKLASAGVL